mgnify:CR=1 FL=1
MVANITAVKNVNSVLTMFVTLVNANTVKINMKINEVVDYFYGLDPAHMSYRHKVGDVYGKKNLKVPHAKLHKAKKKKKDSDGVPST